MRIKTQDNDFSGEKRPKSIISIVQWFSMTNEANSTGCLSGYPLLDRNGFQEPEFQASMQGSARIIYE